MSGAIIKTKASIVQRKLEAAWRNGYLKGYKECEEKINQESMVWMKAVVEQRDKLTKDEIIDSIKQTLEQFSEEAAV